MAPDHEGVRSNSGSPRFKATAGADTFCLYGGPGSSLGKFQLDDGLTGDRQGWIGGDLTETTPAWQRSTFNASNLNGNGPGNHAMWAGRSATQEPLWVTGPGYGNGWDEALEFRMQVVDPAIGQTVGLEFFFNHDSEPGYDFFTVTYDSATTTRTVMSVSGSSQSVGGTFDPPGIKYTAQTDPDPIVYAGGDYPGTEIRITMRALSDGAWSDEDGLWPSQGLAQVDDITVTHLDGISFEDFEGPGPYAWQPVQAPFAGDFGNVFERFSDIDPCRENPSPMYGFIDDGNGPYNPIYTGTGTGGTTSFFYFYGIQGSWTFPHGGGLGSRQVENAVLSPPIPWDLAGPADDDPDVRGAVLQFSVWRHLPGAHAILYSWEVRSRSNDFANWTPFVNRGLAYFSSKASWDNPRLDITGLLIDNPAEVQVRFLALDVAFNPFAQFDGTPAPLFDNVTLKKYRIAGPSIAARNVDLFQDAFPSSGSIAASTLAERDALDVRIDMARDISTGQEIQAGDSLVVDVVSSIPGASIDIADIKMKWQVRANPSFELTLRGNLDNNGLEIAPGVFAGEELAKPAVAADGTVIQDRFFFDLPDQDFFYPGDQLNYYIEATDSAGRVTTLPADISNFDFPAVPQSKAGDPCEAYYYNQQYDPNFHVEAKPSIWTNFTSTPKNVTNVQPSILVINDFGHRGEDELYSAFTSLGHLNWANYDVFTVNGAGSGVSNGIGSLGGHGATPAQLQGYDCIVYLSGDLSRYLISDGSGVGNNDKGDDIGTITQWFDQLGDRAIVHFGDNVVSGLAGPAANTYIDNVMGVIPGDANVSDEIGGQTAPQVLPSGVNAVFSESFIAFGGCLDLNTFDSITPAPGAVKSHEFNFDPQPAAAAGVIWERTVGSFTKRTATFPFGFNYIWDDQSGNSPLTDRALLLQEVLDYFGGKKAPLGPATATDEIADRFTVHRPFPNPFNPATTIQFSAPAFGPVEVEIFNLRGELVARPLKENLPRGLHSVVWRGDHDNGSRAASGVYLVRVTGHGKSETRRVVLLK